jgi:hypothetical protein
MLDTLAAAYAEVGDFTKAISVQQESIALLSAGESNKRSEFESRLRLYQSGRPYRDAGELAGRAHVLLGNGQFAEAEAIAQECLNLREVMIPNHWQTFNAMSMLGGAMLGQRKYAEAEPLLISGYEGMKEREDGIPAAGKARLTEAAERLVQLYEDTGNSTEAAQWRRTLESLGRAPR